MKELLQTFFKTTEDRLKNPFIGAFITSWLVFNWKSILFLTLSSKTIEGKILYVDENMSNRWSAIVFPLLSAIFYTLILPYINLGIDEAVKFSKLKRENDLLDQKKKNIVNEKMIAIEEINLEEAKTEYRGRHKQNNLLEELQSKIAKYEQDIENSRLIHTQRIDELNGEIQSNQEAFDKRYNDILKENQEILMSDLDRRKVISSLENDNQKLQKNVENNFNKLQVATTENESMRNIVKEMDINIFELSQQLELVKAKNKSKRVVYKFSNGIEVFESKNNDMKVYIDKNNSKVYTQDEFDRIGSSHQKFYE